MEENDKDIYKKFGKRLKDIRMSKDITQIQMANDLNISQTAVVQYEAGSRKVPLSMLKKFASYFSMSLDDLVDPNSINTNNDIHTVTNDKTINDDNIGHILFSKYPSLIKFYEKISKDFDEVYLSDEELDKIVDFTKFLISQRK